MPNHPLAAEDRSRVRGRRTTDQGLEVVLHPEDLLAVGASTPLALLQAAYHLGNRHLPMEIRSPLFRSARFWRPVALATKPCRGVVGRCEGCYSDLSVLDPMRLTLSARRAFGASALAASLLLASCAGPRPAPTDSAGMEFDDTVAVGILHSLSGTMAISETTLSEVEKMAIEEINAAGGVTVDGNTYEITWIEEDGASDWPTFAEKAKKLIDQDQVPVVFGGWTSASRKAMLPVFEAKDAFLYYPIQYEGQECSRNIFYTGATPNQQAEPAVEFMFKESPVAGKPFFLVGSDYVFPRTSNTITKAQLESLGGEVVGEDYLPLGNTEVAPIIAKIKKALPDGGAIINTLNGDQNVAFFKQMQAAGLTPENGYYVMSFSIAEVEIDTIGPEYLADHFAAWNFFQAIDTPASQKFTESFKAKYGDDRVTNDPMESAYNMVYLWKAGVEKANSFDDNLVREALIGVTFDAPQGPIEVMPNHHISQTVRIGQVTPDGQFDILSTSDGPIDPQAWNQFEPSSKGYACDWSDPGKGEKYLL